MVALLCCASEAANANGEPVKNIETDAIAVNEIILARLTRALHACSEIPITVFQNRGGVNNSIIKVKVHVFKLYRARPA